MAIIIYTAYSSALLDAFNDAIDQDEKQGKIETWEFSNDRKYYTHSATQWRKKAWLKAYIYKDRLVFNIIKPANKDVSMAEYGFYHGHLIETFLNHFDDAFSSACVTAKGTSNDKCS